MSSVGPNIVGSILQAQLAGAKQAKQSDAEQNKQTDQTRRAQQRATQAQSQVEDSAQTEQLRVRRRDENPRKPKDRFQDTFRESLEGRNGGSGTDRHGQSEQAGPDERRALAETEPLPGPIDEASPDGAADEDREHHIDVQA